MRVANLVMAVACVIAARLLLLVPEAAGDSALLAVLGAWCLYSANV